MADPDAPQVILHTSMGDIVVEVTYSHCSIHKILIDCFHYLIFGRKAATSSSHIEPFTSCFCEIELPFVDVLSPDSLLRENNFIRSQSSYFFVLPYVRVQGSGFRVLRMCRSRALLFLVLVLSAFEIFVDDYMLPLPASFAFFDSLQSIRRFYLCYHVKCF